MILSYNWQILEHPLLTEQEIEERAENYMPGPEDSFVSQESGNLSLAPTLLQCPSFGFLFCYYIQSPQMDQPEIELQPEVTMFEETIRLRVDRKVATKRWIFLQLEIENSQVYDNPLVLTVRIRYHTEPKLPKVGSIGQLVRMAGHRQVNLYTATTYATLKRDLLVESPVLAEWRQGSNLLLGVKLTRPEQHSEAVQILRVEVMNWLAGREDIRKLLVGNLVGKQFALRPKEGYSIVFSCEGNLTGEQIPYYILYRLQGQEKTYKMVKHIGLFNFK